MPSKDSLYSYFSDMTFMKSISLLLTPILSVLISIHSGIFLLFFIMTIDLITGIKKDMIVKNRRFSLFKKSTWLFIESQGLRRTWRKSYEYILGILIFAGVQSVWFAEPVFVLFGRGIFLSEIAVMVLVIIEIHSVFENLSVIRPNSKFIKIVSPIMDKANKYIVQKITNLFK